MYTVSTLVRDGGGLTACAADKESSVLPRKYNLATGMGGEGGDSDGSELSLTSSTYTEAAGL